jgi:ribokinase
VDFDVITIGSATRDVFLKSQGFSIIKSGDYQTGRAECVPLGAKIEVQDIIFTTGGGATNNAVSLARKNFSVACVAAVGADAAGREIEHELQIEKVETRLLQRVLKKKTGFSIILVAPTGDRSVLVYRGASEDIQEAVIAGDRFRARWLYISSVAGNFYLLKRILESAKLHGSKIAINPGSREIKAGIETIGPVLKKAEIIFLNQEEAAYLVETKFQNFETILRKLSNLNPSSIFVITRGPQGVTVLKGDKIWQAGVFKEKARVDRTGAGDAFGSGFLAALMAYPRLELQKQIKQAIRWGSANATSVLEHYGAKKGLLTRQQLDEPRWKKLKITISGVYKDIKV